MGLQNIFVWFQTCFIYLFIYFQACVFNTNSRGTASPWHPGECAHIHVGHVGKANLWLAQVLVEHPLGLPGTWQHKQAMKSFHTTGSHSPPWHQWGMEFSLAPPDPSTGYRIAKAQVGMGSPSTEELTALTVCYLA